VKLGTMMTVFVRLHHSYKPVVNSGDVGHNDDSICKITLLSKYCHHCVQHHLSSLPVYMSNVILQILSSLCPTSPELTPGLYE
jgi:hypothetical protein